MKTSTPVKKLILTNKYQLFLKPMKNFFCIKFFVVAQFLFSQKIAINPINDTENLYKIGFSGMVTENQYAQFIANSDLHPIKGFQFKINPQSKNSTFFFNIYTNENGKPGKITHHLLVETKRNSKSQVISIEFNGLEFNVPREGIFCGIEWITTKKNKIVFDKIYSSEKQDFYYPILSNRKSETDILWYFKNDKWERKLNDPLERNSLDMDASVELVMAY